MMMNNLALASLTEQDKMDTKEIAHVQDLFTVKGVLEVTSVTLDVLQDPRANLAKDYRAWVINHWPKLAVALQMASLEDNDPELLKWVLPGVFR